MTQEKKNLSPELQALADSVGKFIQYWGFKAIHGRIWTLLFLSEEPLSSVELSRYLKVSKTLLSFSVNELLGYQVIHEVGKGPRRTVYLRANPNISSVILNVLRNRERLMIQEAYAAFEVLISGIPETGELPVESSFRLNRAQLQKMGDLIGAVKSLLNSFVLDPDSEVDLVGQFLLIAAALQSEPVA
jgi:DNA-binding transcriptional regulator GbsR (MarR family)